MAGKRGRKPKEPEVVEEVDSEQNIEEAPKKKRGRPNPKDVKTDPKKSEDTKADDEESKGSEDEAKDEEEMEETNDESKDKAESEVMDEKENGAEDDKEEETEEVEEKPKRGRGRQKKEAPKKEKPAPKQAAKGKQKKTAKKAESSDEEDDDKVEIVEEKETAPKRKGRAAKNAHKNGDVESSPKRSSGRNAKKVASYADVESEDEVEVKGGKRGRGGRSKKDNSESDKVDKEVRVVLEHCKSCQVYRRNAVALKEAFERVFDNIDVSINPEKPRRGSFECVLVKEDGTKILLWSGIDKGPPRKLKFPDHQELVSRLQNELKL